MGWKGVGRWVIYLSLHCHHQNDSCIKMDSDENHFKISLIVMDKVTRQCRWLKCCFTSTETVGLLGTGAQDFHLDFHTAPELCDSVTNHNPFEEKGDDELMLNVLRCQLTY